MIEHDKDLFGEDSGTPGCGQPRLGAEALTLEFACLLAPEKMKSLA